MVTQPFEDGVLASPLYLGDLNPLAHSLDEQPFMVAAVYPAPEHGEFTTFDQLDLVQDALAESYSQQNPNLLS